MNRTTTRAIAVGAVALLALALSGCGQQMRAERDGRDLAESICDLQSASDAEDSDTAADDSDTAVEGSASDEADEADLTYPTTDWP